MKKNKLMALLLVLTMLMALFVGCGETTEVSVAESASASEAASTPVAEVEDPEEEQSVLEASVVEEAPVEEGPADFTEANANMDFSGYKEMLKGLHTALPITEEPVTLSYFFGFESNTLNYIEGGVMENHQVWKYLEENTGVDIELRIVDKMQQTDQFNLMIASGDYTDIIPGGDYAEGLEAAYEEEIVVDLTDMVEEYMPNYWTIVNSDKKLLGEVLDGDKFLGIYAIKDQVANPSGTGAFIRMDWLEDLDMEVPTTYDELTAVLEAFKTEKGATEAMALFNTVSMQNGLLMGGFGSTAELSTNGMGGSALNGYYQVDGEVVFGATADGTRNFLSWLNELYNKDLIDFDNMQARETNPFSNYNAGMASDGTNGYIFSNQPFGGEYGKMAASNGDESCNWWPVQDVAQESGAIIPFYEEVSLIDMNSVAISTSCENVEVAMAFLDYGYSYEGSLLYNFGFEIGSGMGSYETYSIGDDGEPIFDQAALKAVADTTNLASGVISTKDLAGVVFDKRLSFEFGERELACFDAWSTNKNTNNILGSATTFDAEEGESASAIYSDILTYVATATLQFINGDLDVNDDAVWESYVADIEAMNVAELTEIVQGAYDRATP